jgi:hypothetical protein
MTQWHPINENHAIDVMAAIVTFAEPIPDLIFRRMVKATEEVAFASGLRSRHLFQQQAMSITVGASGQPSVQQVPAMVTGRMFNSVVEGSAEEPVSGRVAEQVQVIQNFIAYRTWQYVSWNWQLERIWALLEPALSMVVGSVFVGNQRLEYLDRFYSEDSAGFAPIESLLRRDSPHIAPHVFSRTDLWHSHTGAFLPDEGSSKRLEQVHIDAVDQPVPSGSGNARWINLMTARENRYTDSNVDQSSQSIFSTFDGMHADLIKLLAGVITKDIADQIYLMNGAKQ